MSASGSKSVVARLQRANGVACPRLSRLSDVDVARHPGYMRLMLCRPCAPGLLFGAGLLSTTTQAQRAGSWESRVEVAGRAAVAPSRECMAADLPRRAMSRWPADCSVVARAKRASGAFVEAACRSGGSTLTIRRELTESSDRDYTIVTTSRIDRAGGAPQILPATSLRAHYAGPCPDPRGSTGEGQVRGDASASMPSATILWIVQLLAFVGFIYASIRGWHWLIRRLARSRYERATVANITIDQAGAANIPVLATFSGVRGLPWWYAVATNNAKPSLVVTPRGLDFRVVRRHQRSWDEIERIDVRQASETVNLDVIVTDSACPHARARMGGRQANLSKLSASHAGLARGVCTTTCARPVVAQRRAARGALYVPRSTWPLVRAVAGSREGHDPLLGRRMGSGRHRTVSSRTGAAARARSRARCACPGRGAHRDPTGVARPVALLGCPADEDRRQLAYGPASMGYPGSAGVAAKDRRQHRCAPGVTSDRSKNSQPRYASGRLGEYHLAGDRFPDLALRGGCTRVRNSVGQSPGPPPHRCWSV
jgi:hypothetical protein